MTWFLDIRNKYLRLSKPMFLTVDTYLKCGRELHPTRTKTIVYSFEWKINNLSYKELKLAMMVPF